MDKKWLEKQQKMDENGQKIDIKRIKGEQKRTKTRNGKKWANLEKNSSGQKVDRNWTKRTNSGHELTKKWTKDRQKVEKLKTKSAKVDKRQKVDKLKTNPAKVDKK